MRMTAIACSATLKCRYIGAFPQVDPPRAGLDPATEALLPEFANVVYISCNPATLEANLRPLLATHSLRRFAVFDQARPVDMLVLHALLLRLCHAPHF